MLVWFVQKMFLCIIAFLLLFVGTIIFHTSGRLRFIQIVFGNQLCTCILWFTQGQSAFETNCCRETTALAWFTQVQSAFQTNCLRESTVHLLFLIKRANNWLGRAWLLRVTQSHTVTSAVAVGGGACPQDLFTIMQFSGNFERKHPILRLGPPDQNPGSAPCFSQLDGLYCVARSFLLGRCKCNGYSAAWRRTRSGFTFCCSTLAERDRLLGVAVPAAWLHHGARQQDLVHRGGCAGAVPRLVHEAPPVVATHLLHLEPRHPHYGEVSHVVMGQFQPGSELTNGWFVGQEAGGSLKMQGGSTGGYYKVGASIRGKMGWLEGRLINQSVDGFVRGSMFTHKVGGSTKDQGGHPRRLAASTSGRVDQLEGEWDQPSRMPHNKHSGRSNRGWINQMPSESAQNVGWVKTNGGPPLGVGWWLLGSMRGWTWYIVCSR